MLPVFVTLDMLPQQRAVHAGSLAQQQIAQSADALLAAMLVHQKALHTASPSSWSANPDRFTSLPSQPLLRPGHLNSQGQIQHAAGLACWISAVARPAVDALTLAHLLGVALRGASICPAECSERFLTLAIVLHKRLLAECKEGQNKLQAARRVQGAVAALSECVNMCSLPSSLCAVILDV